MLPIIIPKGKLFDQSEQKFIPVDQVTLHLEHSLLSLSLWEMKWKKPFLSPDRENKMTSEQIIDYIKCMTLNDNVDPSVYYRLTKKNIEDVMNYIEDPMTATIITEHEKPSRKGAETLTNEVIYYYMSELNIPYSCETWHLNRLLTLIRVAAIKKQPPKKMGRRDQMSQQRALNEARKMKHNTRG